MNYDSVIKKVRKRLDVPGDIGVATQFTSGCLEKFSITYNKCSIIWFREDVRSKISVSVWLSASPVILKNFLNTTQALNFIDPPTPKFAIGDLVTVKSKILTRNLNIANEMGLIMWVSGRFRYVYRVYVGGRAANYRLGELDLVQAA